MTSAAAANTASQFTTAANNRRSARAETRSYLGGPYATFIHAGYGATVANIKVSKKASGPVHYRLQYTVDTTTHTSILGNPAEATIRADTALSEWSSTGGQPVDSVTRGTVEGYHSARFSTKLYDNAGDKTTSVLSGVIYTDYDTTIDANNDGTPEADTDYLAIGIWAVEDVDDNGAVSHAVAMATGRNQSKQTYIAGLSDSTKSGGALGAVTYTGFAAGKHVRDGKVRDFTGTVSLTANFDDSITGLTAGNHGTVTGEIGLGDAGKMVLQQSEIATNTGISAASWFAGDTKLVGTDGMDVTGFTGNYRGGFFGSNDDAAGPPAAAGTFGASNTGNTESYVGGFMAKR